MDIHLLLTYLANIKLIILNLIEKFQLASTSNPYLNGRWMMFYRKCGLIKKLKNEQSGFSGSTKSADIEVGRNENAECLSLHEPVG